VTMLDVTTGVASAQPLRFTPTLVVYAAVILATTVYSIRTGKISTFVLRRVDYIPVAIALLAIAVSYLIQVSFSFSLGSCAPSPSMNHLDLFELLLLANILAPIAETIIIQGWCYDFGRFLFGTRAAVAITSIAFIAIHLSASISLVVAAVALAVLRARTDRLAAPLAVHFAVNLGVTAIAISSIQR
jgi:membrane protease YdiL (CAAX protease family)